MKLGRDLIFLRALLAVLRRRWIVRLDVDSAVEDEVYLTEARMEVGDDWPDVGTDHHVELAVIRRPQDHAEVSPVLAGLVGASVQGRVALGPRAGARVRRLGGEPDLGDVTSRSPRQAQLDGFDLHANVWVPPPNDCARLEQFCPLHPPLAQDRVQLRADGRVLVALKTVWRDRLCSQRSGSQFNSYWYTRTVGWPAS